MTGNDEAPAPESPANNPEAPKIEVPSRASPWLALRRHKYFIAGAIGAALVIIGVTAVFIDRAVRTAQPVQSVAVVASAPAPSAAKSTSANGTVTLEWKDTTGRHYRASVGQTPYRAFEVDQRRRFADTLQLMNDATGTRIRAAMAPIFEEVEGRVPRFANWVFDWWTSWILLARSLRWTWDSVVAGHVMTAPDRVQARLVDEIERQFIDRVLSPAATEPKLTAALDRTMASLSRDLERECAADEAAFHAFLARSATQVEREDGVDNWAHVSAADANTAKINVPCALDEKNDSAIVRDELSKFQSNRDVNAPVNEVILRLSRPFATKLISFVVLPVIVTALIGGVALPLLGILPNIISGVVTGIITGAAGAAIIGFSASASVDWLLNRTDEQLNRASFEAQVRRAVIAGRIEFENKIVDAQRKLIERQLRAIVDASLAQEPKP